MERRLAAILAADVVGYSRLMGADEAGTFGRLTALREEVVAPKVAERQGRIVKLMGDGILAEFGSVVQAVDCAVEIQRLVIEREAALPEDDRIRLRIGVNLGDVIVEAADIYGDGVNVAARLEGLAEPGGICLSGPAYDTVEGKLDLAFEELGPQPMKNIARPVRVYRVRPAVAPTAKTARPALAPKPSRRPAIAVLPFVNLSRDADQQYFSDGVTEDVSTELTRFRTIEVLARQSAFALRDQSADLRAAVARLGADYVLEGSLRRAGNRIRLTAQLIEVGSGRQVWADRYDRSWTTSSQSRTSWCTPSSPPWSDTWRTAATRER